MRGIYLIYLLIHFSILSFATNEGNPIVRNFAPSKYLGGSRVYSVVCTSNGMLYAGDKSGVLEFDGENWQKINTGFPVTSMCADKNNSIYIAGSKGIGRLQNDSTNVLKYSSLNHYLPEISTEQLRLSKVFNLNGKIVFVLGSEILIITDERLRIIESPHNFQYYQNLNNQLYLYSPDDGIYRMADSKLELVSNQSELLDESVCGFFNHAGQDYLLANRKGICRFDKNETEWIKNDITSFLGEAECHGIDQVDDSTYVLRTFYNGLYMFQNSGQRIKNYTYEDGLINNTVLSVFKDSWGNLWAGTAAGISAVRLEFPLTVYNSRQGIGTGYAAQVVGEKIYLATSQGLYLKQGSEAKTENYKQLFAGHILGLHKIGNTLYFGHVSGIYTLENDKITLISTIPGGSDLKPIPGDERYAIASTVKGLLLLQKTNNNRLSPLHIIKGTEQLNYHFEFDSTQNIWAESKFGVSKCKLSEGYDQAEDVENFDRIESGNRIRKIRKIADELYFIADSGIYTYNVEEAIFDSTVFSAYCSEMHLLPSNICVDKRDLVWIFTDKSLLHFMKSDDEFVKTSSGILEYASKSYPTNYENICEIDSNLVLIGQEEGFLCYDRRKSNYGLYSSVDIRKIQLTSKEGEIKNSWGQKKIVDQSQVVTLAEDISYNYNSIKFYFSSGCSNYNESLYQTYLIGFDTKWSEWSRENIREFTNLAPGEYRFIVRSVNRSNQYSHISNCSFTVKRPWYRSRLAWLTYLVLLVAFVVAGERIVRMRVKTIQQKNRKREEELKFRKEQERIQLELKNEKELIRLKNEKLKVDILYKSKELADSTMSIIEKNRFLTDLKTELEQIKLHSEGKKVVTSDIVKLIRKINKGIDNEENWKVFEDYFDNVHENFFKKMKKKFPILTAKDLRLCAYLRMNLSTKEISPLLNISVRGVEISRYRLRKKLGIEKDANLIDFLLKI
ncbi:two-component regulator propeller domain-containing protein [Mangrovibacterium sp.]|uniref:two-component regulator propeller domain-containing protein n=1 Tax=Mangrovibacterium sp. TaxID=1961364 RepID=UPI003568D13C